MLNNISSYLGMLELDSNKEYQCYEYRVKDNQYVGALTVKVDRETTVYLFQTNFNAATKDRINDQLITTKNIIDDGNSFMTEISINQLGDARFVIVLEYNTKLDTNGIDIIPLKPIIKFSRFLLSSTYFSDFFMFETKSGIPYPAHDIGTYSRYEFDSQQTATTSRYDKIGELYNITSRTLLIDPDKPATEGNIALQADNIVTVNNMKKHITLLLKGIMGKDYRAIITQGSDFIVNTTGTTIAICITNINNIDLMTKKITQNKIIRIAEDAKKFVRTEYAYLNILQNILDATIYSNVVTLVNELVTISLNFNVTLQKYANDMLNYISELADYRNRLNIFIKGLFDVSMKTELMTYLTTLTDIDLKEYLTNIYNRIDDISPKTEIILTMLGESLKIINETYRISFYTENEEYTFVKAIYLQTMSDTPSGRIDMQGQSIHTGKYASSKILVGHKHENERGYLKHTVATDKYGKSHKDPFVKNREVFGKEEDYIYLDLLRSTKNLFANSNKMIRGVALLTDKQWEEPPRSTITFWRIDYDLCQELGLINLKEWPVRTYIDFKRLQIEDPDTYNKIVLAVDIFENVHNAHLAVDREWLFEYKDSSFVYLLKNRSTYTKLIIKPDKIPQEFTFWYTQQIGDFVYKFVDINISDEDIRYLAEDYIITNKTSHNYKAPNRISMNTPAPPITLVQDSDKIYKLVTPLITVYNTVQSKGQVITTEFKYELITSTFIFYLVSKDDYNYLLPVVNNDGIELLPPENSNPITYANVTKVDYTAPAYVRTDELYRWKLIGTNNFFGIASELTPTIERHFEYELIRSKFIFSFVEDNAGALIPAQQSEDPDNTLTIIDGIDGGFAIAAICTAEKIIHLASMKDDEYYILEDNFSIPGYPTVKLVNNEFAPNQTVSFQYKYKRLVGTIKFTYKTEAGEYLDIPLEDVTYTYDGIDISNVKKENNVHIFDFVTSVKVKPPSYFQINENKSYTIIEPSEVRLVITPDELEISHTFIYKVTYGTSIVNFNLTSSCHQRTYAKFVLLDENDIILDRFDVADNFNYESIPGFKIDLKKSVTYRGSTTGNTTVMPQDAPGGPWVKDDDDVRVNDYLVTLQGNFEFNVKYIQNKIIKLVGFINDSSRIDVGGESLFHEHNIFYLRYDPSRYGTSPVQSYTAHDFRYLGSYFYPSTELNPGNTLFSYQTTIFMEIDLSKEKDKEIFTIYDSYGGILNPTSLASLLMDEIFTVS